MPKGSQGWLRKKMRADGETWLFCFYVSRANDNRRVEHSKRVGLVRDLPTEADAWIEVGKLGLKKVLDNPISCNPTFGELAQHWRVHDVKKEGVIGKRSGETIACIESNLDGYVLPRWGAKRALEIEVSEVEAWFEELASRPQSKALPDGKQHRNGYRSKPLTWSTIQKFRSIMSQVFAHAMRNRLIPVGAEHNPFRDPNTEGGVRCAYSSEYDATIATPEETFAILAYLNTPETQMEWMLVLLHAATALRGEECFGLKWEDIDWAKGKIWIKRGWSKGVETKGKNKHANGRIEMHPALAAFLRQYRAQSLYPSDHDWVFPSYRLKGKKPRSASIAAKDYLRPAAVHAGVIEANSTKRFGWHNLRHSLASYLSDKYELPVIMKMLRQKQVQTAMRYIHSNNRLHQEAQGRFLEDLKLIQPQPSTTH